MSNTFGIIDIHDGAVYIWVRGKPVGKGRPRFTRSGHTYTPETTREAEDRIRLLLASYLLDKIEAPIAMDVTAFFEPPKSWSKKKRAEVRGKPCTSKPDADNILKLVLDAMNGVMYSDDKEVTQMSIKKLYADEGDEEGVKIELRRVL